MLKAWHLPVAPFIKVQQDRLFITLWLSGESLPQRITLRAEEDNEELSLPMQRLRRAPQRAWWHGAAKSLASGQPRRRYSFKLLWADHQRWFTPQGFTRFPPARLEQFAIDLPDAGPQWVADQVFYQIFPDRFARSAARDADRMRSITITRRDGRLCAGVGRPAYRRGGRVDVLRRGSRRHQRKTSLPEAARRNRSVSEPGFRRPQRA